MTILFAQPIEQYPAHLAFNTVPVVQGGTDPNFPAGFLLTRDPTQVCKFPMGANGNTILWDFTRRRKFDVISMIGTGFTSGGIYSVQGSNDGVNFTTIMGTSPLWPNLSIGQQTLSVPEDEDLDVRKGSLERINTFVYFPVLQHWRYLRINFDDSSALTSTIGRLFVGRSFKPSNTWQYGSGFTFDDTGTSERTDQGSLASLDGKTILSASVKMDFLSTAEMYDFIYEFNYWRRSTGEILCCLDLETKSRLQKNVFYATIKDGRKVVAEQFEAWSQTWIVERI